MPIIKHPFQFLPRMPARNQLSEPPQRNRILDAILKHAARWSRRPHHVPMYPRRERTGYLPVGELAPFLAAIDEVPVPRDPSQLHWADVQHEHSERPVDQRCGLLLDGHLLPRRNQLFERVGRLMPRKDVVRTCLNLRTLRKRRNSAPPPKRWLVLAYSTCTVFRCLSSRNLCPRIRRHRRSRGSSPTPTRFLTTSESKQMPWSNPLC